MDMDRGHSDGMSSVENSRHPFLFLSAPRSWIRIALLNGLAAFSIGAILRFAFVEEIPWLNFRHWLHAHSHVAMLGWVYQALYSYFVFSMLPATAGFRKYILLFWLSQLSIIGMLICFPISGYNAWSIAFSTAHTLLSYVFIYFFWKDTRHEPTTVSLRFAKAALFFLFLSTLALWAMIPIMFMELQGETVYYLSIQFYLHFQFNGWFIFGILSLFFKWMESYGVAFAERKIQIFSRLLILSTYLTFALAVSWAYPIPAFFYLNSIGVLLQIGALLLLLSSLGPAWQAVRHILTEEVWKKPNPLRVMYSWVRFFLLVSFSSLLLKILIQSAVAIPYIATIAYTVRNLAMGFLHLQLVGLVSFFLIGYGVYAKSISMAGPTAKAGTLLFFIGFLGSELLLFGQGVMFWMAAGFLPFYYEILFCFSAFLPLGIALLLLDQLRLTCKRYPIIGRQINR